MSCSLCTDPQCDPARIPGSRTQPYGDHCLVRHGQTQWCFDWPEREKLYRENRARCGEPVSQEEAQHDLSVVAMAATGRPEPAVKLS